MIQYFLESLRPFIRVQLDSQGRELDFWEEVVEKAFNAEVKALLQLSSSTRKIDSRCPQGNKSAKNEEKDSEKNKSTDSTSTDTPSRKKSSFTQQTSSAQPKKNQNHYDDPCHRQKYRQGQDLSATGVNVTSKKEKRDISHVKCFNCKKKGYYANWCPQKEKQESKN